MVYRLLGDAVIILHFLWILFILFGLLIGIKYGRLIPVHLGGLVFTLILNIGGWFCPLTYLENYLYRLYNPRGAHLVMRSSIKSFMGGEASTASCGCGASPGSCCD